MIHWMRLIPHNEYGGDYLHIAKGIKIGSKMEKGPVIIGQLEEQKEIYY